MECGKLTAKLRDAVPVCFMVLLLESRLIKLTNWINRIFRISLLITFVKPKSLIEILEMVMQTYYIVRKNRHNYCQKTRKRP